MTTIVCFCVNISNCLSITDAIPYSLYIPTKRTLHAHKNHLPCPMESHRSDGAGIYSKDFCTYNGSDGRCDVFGVPSILSVGVQAVEVRSYLCVTWKYLPNLHVLIIHLPSPSDVIGFLGELLYYNFSK